MVTFIQLEVHLHALLHFGGVDGSDLGPEKYILFEHGNLYELIN